MELLNEVQTFTRLGLTLNQARIYIALVQMGTSDAQQVAAISKVARSDIYRVLPGVEKLGLVERTLTSPCKFRAISMERAIHLLIDRRLRETTELQTMAKETLRKVAKYTPKIAPKKDDLQFAVISKMEADISKRKGMIQSAKICIDSVTTIRKLNSVVLQNETCKALRRGVKIRGIMEKPNDEAKIADAVEKFERDGCFELRYVLGAPETNMTIFDRREVLVPTSEADSLGESPDLWSCNPNLVLLLQEHFDFLWLTSIKRGYSTIALAN